MNRHARRVEAAELRRKLRNIKKTCAIARGKMSDVDYREFVKNFLPPGVT